MSKLTKSQTINQLKLIQKKIKKNEDESVSLNKIEDSLENALKEFVPFKVGNVLQVEPTENSAYPYRRWMIVHHVYILDATKNPIEFKLVGTECTKSGSRRKGTIFLRNSECNPARVSLLANNVKELHAKILQENIAESNAILSEAERRKRGLTQCPHCKKDFKLRRIRSSK